MVSFTLEQWLTLAAIVIIPGIWAVVMCALAGWIVDREIAGYRRANEIVAKIVAGDWEPPAPPWWQPWRRAAYEREIAAWRNSFSEDTVI